MLHVNSGYAFLGGMPGNVLLAFSVDGKREGPALASIVVDVFDFDAAIGQIFQRGVQ